MRTIFKYPLPEPGHSATLELPRGAEIVHVDLTYQDVLCAWALVDTDAPLTCRLRVETVGTGRRIEGVGRHLGTVLRGAEVWHVVVVTEGDA